MKIKNILRSLLQIKFSEAGEIFQRKLQVSNRSQAGNVFFTLFGAVALVGVVGVATTQLMQGPLGTVLTLNQRAQVESQLQIARRLTALEATDLDAEATYVEPPQPDTATAGCGAPLGLTGGGCIPATIGAAKTDPWGTLVGYCGWNHGTVTTGVAGLLDGTNDTNRVVIALISAGPDRQFQSSCNNHPTYVTKLGDDIIMEWTFDEAGQGLGGGLWSLKSGDPNVVTTDKEVEIGQDATFAAGTTAAFEGTARFGSAGRLDFSTGGLLALPTQATSGACNGGNDGMLRRFVDATDETLQICAEGSGAGPDNDGWINVGGSASAAADGPTGAIQFSDGATPAALTHDTNLTFTAGTLNAPAGDFSGALSVGTTLNAGATTVSSLDTSGDITDSSDNIVTINDNLNVSGDITGTGNVVLDGNISDTSGDVVIEDNLDLNGALDLTGSITDVGDNIVTVDDDLNVTGDGDIDGALVIGGELSDSDGDVVIADNLDLNGDIDVQGSATVGTDILLGGEILDSGDSTVNIGENLDVNGNVSLSGQILDSSDSIVDVGENLRVDGYLDVVQYGLFGDYVRIGDSTATCNSTTEGALRYDTDRLQVCIDGTGWTTLGAAAGGGGGVGGLWDQVGATSRIKYDAGFVGVGIADPLTDFHVEGDILVTGTHTGTASVPASGAGTRMFFDPEMSAFRAGAASGTEWDNASIGEYSAAFGESSNASGPNSFAAGQDAQATNNSSTAFGNGTIASGEYSFVFGGGGTASGDYAIGGGQASIASGAYSVALGDYTISSGVASVALGREAVAGSGTPNATLGAGHGNYTMAIGLLSGGQATDPRITGDRSMGIFMGPGADSQSGYDLTASDVMALIGGRMLIDPSRPGVETNVSGILDLDVEGQVGAIQYCDEDGLNCFTAADITGGATGVWEDNGNLIRPTSGLVNYASADFVFGSQQLDDIAGETWDDNRMFFDKSKGAFRAGRVTGTDWDEWLIGDYSVAMGSNTAASGPGSMAMGATTIASGTLSTAIGREVIAGSGTADPTYTLGAGHGHNTFAIGLLDTSQATEPPSITGDRSFGIFMGSGADAQSGVNITASDVMAIVGGKLIIDPRTGQGAGADVTPSTGGVEDLVVDVLGAVGATNFCDADGNNCFTAATVATNESVGGDREILFNSGGSMSTAAGFVYTSGGRFGLGSASPQTLADFAGEEPYLTLRNTTAEDTDGGRESRLIFEGTDSGSTVSALGRIEASHRGTGTDQLGQMRFDVNDGTGPQTVMTLLDDGTDASVRLPDSVDLGWGDGTSRIDAAGPGDVSVFSRDAEVLRLNGGSGHVNYTQLSSAAANGTVSMSAAGTDANIDMALMPKGTGGIGIGTTVVSGTVTGGADDLLMDVQGNLGAVQYCDANGNNCVGADEISVVVGAGASVWQDSGLGYLLYTSAVGARITPVTNVTAPVIPNYIANSAGPFVSLSDTPSDYVGFADGFVKINAAATGLEYIAGNQVRISGADRQIQFNSSGGFWADPNFVFDANGTLQVTQTGTDPIFRANDQASDTTPFVVDADGEVGIGTTTPDDALEIHAPLQSGITFRERPGTTVRGQIQMGLGPNPNMYFMSDNRQIFTGGLAGTPSVLTINPTSDAVGIRTESPSTGGEQDLFLDVDGAMGAVYYCDENGNNCFVASALANSALAGSDRQIQFNSGGVMSAAAGFEFTPDGTLVITQTGAFPGLRVNDVSGDTTPVLVSDTGALIVGSTQMNDTGTGNEDRRMFFDPALGALRAGVATGTEWDTRGNGSVALGRNTQATGANSIALGSGVVASGNTAISMGSNDSDASGARSFVLGNSLEASGNDSFAFGHAAVAGSGTVDATDTLNAGHGHHSMAFGIQSSTHGTNPVVTGDRSVVFFFDSGVPNANDNYNFGDDDKFAIIGGEMQIGETQAQGAEKACLRFNNISNELEFANDCTSYFPFAGGEQGFVVLSRIQAATESNVIDNDEFEQTWMWNSLTTENGLSLGSSSVTSGSVVYISSSNDAGAATGNVLELSAGGTSTQMVALNITNEGTGNTVVINDEPGDASPIVIDADGRMGIGNSSPQTILDVTGVVSVSERIALGGVAGTAPAALGINLLGDVHTPAPADGQCLVYDGTTDMRWESGPCAAGLLNVVEDTTPQLGGNLDVAGYEIVSVTNGDIVIAPDGTGSVVLDGLNWPQSDGTANYFLQTDGAGNLGWAAASGGASTALDDFAAADAINTIDNASHAQTWNWNSLTTGNGLELATSSITTGSLLNVTASHNSVTSTGSAARFNVTGLSSLAVPLTLDNQGAGLSFRVNDTASDPTPFVITADGSLVIGSHQINDTTTGSQDVRLIYEPSLGAFRAGAAQANQWDVGNLGAYSFATGLNTQATGIASVAIGQGTRATVMSSFAGGEDSIASGTRSFAYGHTVQATGSASMAWGGQVLYSSSGPIASGNQSTAFGEETVASATISTAWGSRTIANALGATAFGNEVQINNGADYSIAVGLQTTQPVSRPRITGERSMVLFFDQGTTNANGGFNFTDTDKFALVGGELVISETQQQGFQRGCIRFNEATNQLEFSNDCTDYASLTPGVGVDGAIQYISGGELYGTGSFTFTSGGMTIAQAGTDPTLSISDPNGSLEFSSGGLTLTHTGTDPVLTVNDEAGDASPFVITADGALIVGSTQFSDTGTGNEDNRMFFDPASGSFRAGSAESLEWDTLGTASVALGQNTSATNSYSFAMGNDVNVTGLGSVGFGNNNVILTGDRNFGFGTKFTTAGNGHAVFGLGVSGGSPSEGPNVNGVENFVIFMNDQQETEFNASRSFGLIGGRMYIDPAQTAPDVTDADILAPLHVVGDIAVGNDGSGSGAVAFYEDSANGQNSASIEAPAALGADYTLVLPANDGDADQVLRTDGLGVLSWADVPTVAAPARSLQFNNAGDLGGSANLTYDANGTLVLSQTGANNAFLVNDQAGDTTPFVIDQNGNTGIGVAAPGFKLDIAGNVQIQGTSTTCVLGDGSGATNCTSDERLKTDIELIEGSLDKIDQLRGVTFRWKDETKRQDQQVGVIAQDVEAVFPQIVGELQDGTKTVDYAALVAPLIEASKELKARNEALRTELADVKAVQQQTDAQLQQLQKDIAGLKTHTGYGLNKAQIGLWFGLGMLLSLLSFLGVAILRRQRA